MFKTIEYLLHLLQQSLAMLLPIAYHYLKSRTCRSRVLVFLRLLKTLGENEVWFLKRVGHSLLSFL